MILVVFLLLLESHLEEMQKITLDLSQGTDCLMVHFLTDAPSVL